MPDLKVALPILAKLKPLVDAAAALNNRIMLAPAHNRFPDKPEWRSGFKAAQEDLRFCDEYELFRQRLELFGPYLAQAMKLVREIEQPSLYPDANAKGGTHADQR